MSRPIARTLGALALAGAVITNSTVAFAATPTGGPGFYVNKKRVNTLAGLSPELRRNAVEKARSRPNGPTLKDSGGTSQSGPSNEELNLACGNDWFITWAEDADGHPILGTFDLICGETKIPIG